MKSKEIVERLIKGSEALDRMKKEIDMLAKMITGFVVGAYQNDHTHKIRELNFEVTEGVCKWCVAYEPTKERDINIVCYVDDPELGWLRAYCTFEGGNNYRSQVIQIVHDSLPLLIGALLKEIPSIDEQWQHLIRASKKRF